MRQAEEAQRRFLQRLKRGAQRLRKRAETGDQVIIRAEKNRPPDETDREPREKLPQVAIRINVNMRTQPVAQRTRKVIHKQLIPELISPAAVNPMRLERVPAIGAE